MWGRRLLPTPYLSTTYGNHRLHCSRSVEFTVSIFNNKIVHELCSNDYRRFRKVSNTNVSFCSFVECVSFNAQKLFKLKIAATIIFVCMA